MKDVLTPKTEEDVIFNVQESIKQTAQIERVSSNSYYLYYYSCLTHDCMQKKVQVKLYPAEQDDGISRIKTFSGKTIRQELRFNYDECDPHESRFKEYHHPLIGPSLVSVN